MPAPPAEIARRYGPWLFVLAAALAAYPPALALARDGTLGAFRYLAADAFYYLTVAAKSVSADAYTFDGVHPTNGFHPLWQFALERAFAWLPLDSAGRVFLAVGAGAVLVAIGSGLFAVAVLRLTGRPALSLLAAVPGAYDVLVPGIHGGAPWSFVNGMESPLSIFFFGVLLILLTRRLDPAPAPDARRLLLVSLMLTLLTLARLDDVFLFAPFLLWVGATAPSLREASRRLLVAAAPPLLVLGSFLAYNQVTAGSLLPSSGTSKAEPLLALARNGYAVLTTLAPFLDLLGRAGDWKAESWRVAQMVVPAVVAAAWLAARGRSLLRREAESGRDAIIGLLAGYVLLKAAYNFAVVALWHQGHWYYPVSIMTANGIAAVAASAWLDRAGSVAPSQRARRGLAPAVAAAGLFALWSASAWAAEQRDPEARDRRHVFWSERAETLALFERHCAGCGLLSFDDGIIAYSLPEVSTLNGLGLTMDAEALRARDAGRLLDLAWDRGIRLLASVSYEMPDAAFTSPASLRAHLRAYPYLRGQSVERWRFEVVFETRDARVRFVRFSPANASYGQGGNTPSVEKKVANTLPE